MSMTTGLPPEVWRTELFRVRFAPVTPAPVAAAARVVASTASLGDRLLAALAELKTVPEADLPVFTRWCSENALALFGLTASDLQRLWAAIAPA